MDCSQKWGGGGEGKVQLSHTKTIYPNVMSTSPMWIFSRFLTFACCAINNNHEKKIHKGAGIYRNPRYVSSVNDKFDKLRLQRRSNFDKVLGELLSCYLKVQFQSSDSLSTSTTSPPGTLQMGLFKQSLARV